MKSLSSQPEQLGASEFWMWRGRGKARLVQACGEDLDEPFSWIHLLLMGITSISTFVSPQAVDF